MKRLIFVLALLTAAQIATATTRHVSLHQALPSHYTSIQAAINASANGDTIIVWPGTYFEQVDFMSKNIGLLGSGCEVTKIVSSASPAVSMTTGLLQWFSITSTGGTGVFLNGGNIRNCVIISCAGSGIYSTAGTAKTVQNCVLINNGSYGIRSDNEQYVLNVTNCISRNNAGYGFNGITFYSNTALNLSYSNGSRYYTSNNQGCIDTDPGFVSPPFDLHIAQDSTRCWNTGHPSLLDPDGSRSDMGYFGGPDCPVFPIVSSMTMTVNGSTVQINVTGRANY
jgi:hypothetical protein